jgi:hypothetical protein
MLSTPHTKLEHRAHFLAIKDESFEGSGRHYSDFQFEFVQAVENRQHCSMRIVTHRLGKSWSLIHSSAPVSEFGGGGRMARFLLFAVNLRYDYVLIQSQGECCHYFDMLEIRPGGKKPKHVSGTSGFG